MNYLGIIPARYESTRLPGKPLAEIDGKTMIRRVFERANKVFEHLIVATDDERVLHEIESFGGIAVMTSLEHRSGTSRCAEALDIYRRKSGLDFDIVVNIQGDEPFIDTEQLITLKGLFVNFGTQIATLVKKVDSGEELFNTSKPKVVLSKAGKALYFSRQTIPFIRGKEEKEWLKAHTFYKHIGVYAYRSDVLKKIVLLPASELEKAESLEQNAWLENGFEIQTAPTEIESLSVDTPEDLEIARRFALSQKK